MEELKKIVGLLRSLKYDQMELALILATGAVPEFSKWFENQVTKLLIQGDASFIKCVLNADGLSCMWRYDPYIKHSHTKISSFKYRGMNFFKILLFYIRHKGYFESSPLHNCNCSAQLTHCQIEKPFCSLLPF
jgi:hypothetical protein